MSPVDPAVFCDVLQAAIESYAADVRFVEALKGETAMIVHFEDGSELLVEVSGDE